MQVGARVKVIEDINNKYVGYLGTVTKIINSVSVYVQLDDTVLELPFNHSELEICLDSSLVGQ